MASISALRVCGSSAVDVLFLRLSQSEEAIVENANC